MKLELPSTALSPYATVRRSNPSPTKNAWNVGGRWNRGKSENVKSSAVKDARTSGGITTGGGLSMDEIDYQLSLILLDLLKSNDLLTDQEAAKTDQLFKQHYQPIVTGLTGLNCPSE